MNLAKITDFDWLPWQPKGYIFENIIQKSFFSKAIEEMKLKLCLNVHDISLYINSVVIIVAHVLLLLWQLKISIYTYTYNEKSGNWHLFLCYCRYFDKSVTEMFLE